METLGEYYNLLRFYMNIPSTEMTRKKCI